MSQVCRRSSFDVEFLELRFFCRVLGHFIRLDSLGLCLQIAQDEPEKQHEHMQIQKLARCKDVFPSFVFKMLRY